MKTTMRPPRLIGLAIFLTLPSSSMAKAQADDQQPPTWRIEIHAAAEPEAALSLQLLPPVTKRRAGNAAILYNKLAIEYSPLGEEAKRRMDLNERWLRLPMSELPIIEVRAFLRSHEKIIDDLGLATRCETCDWQLPIGEGDVLEIRLPETSAMRRFAQLLALRARLQIRDKDFEEALATVQGGFALALHVVRQPFLISGLTGIAIGEIMESVLIDWIRQRGAPNLYWALTALPRPLIDLRAAAELERQSLFFSFPELLELDAHTRTAEYWQQVLDRLVAYLAKHLNQRDGFEFRLPLTLHAVKEFAAAKRLLIERGRSREEVEKLPAAQVLLLDAVHSYQVELDRAFKHIYLPYDVLHDDADRFDLFRAPTTERAGTLRLATAFMPAVDSYHFHWARHERRIALLRILEALRRYGAAHQMRLPEHLDADIGVPIPADPVRGKPFEYRLDGDRAVLEGLPPPGKSASEGGARFEIWFAR